MLFLPSNRWVWTLSPLSTSSPLASLLWHSLSICSKTFQRLAVLFQLQDFRLGKLKGLLAILDMARVQGLPGPPWTFYSIHKHNMPVCLQAIPKKSLMQHWALGGKCSAFSLLVCIMVMTGYTAFNHLVRWLHGSQNTSDSTWLAWVQVLWHRPQSTLWSAWGAGLTLTFQTSRKP